MTTFAHRMPFGAAFDRAGSARFRLWAPARREVWLQIDGREPLPMTPAEPGWFELHAGCRAGDRYRYRVADGLAVPDPASRHQPDDVGGPSVVVDPHAYAWRHGQWRGRPWSEAVIYELHAGLCGGYAGVASRLPELARLGVTAIELMPLAEFPGRRNWGYDGVLPFAPESAYGSPHQLKALIDQAHGLGLMVLLDVVYNHFGPQGNYLAHYAPDFFRTDRRTPWGDAIDLRQRPVREFFLHNALYWLMEYRFDGLRLDAVHAIGDADWLQELARDVRASVEPGRHVHLVLENEDNDAALLAERPGERFDAQWNDDAHNALHVLLTGERHSYYADYGEPARKLARVLAEGFAWQGEPSARRDGRPRGSRSAGLPPTAFVMFLQNHDQVGNRAHGERLIALTSPAALRAATLLHLLCPQIPLLFMGEEWGCRTPFLFFADYRGALAAAVREGRRSEFADAPAFADPKARETIADPNDPATFERCRLAPESRRDAAQREWRALYGELLGARQRHIVPHLGGCRPQGARALDARAVEAAWRLGNGALLQIALNVGDAPVRVTPPRGRAIAQSHAGVAERAQAGELAGAAAFAFVGDRA